MDSTDKNSDESLPNTMSRELLIHANTEEENVEQMMHLDSDDEESEEPVDNSQD